MHLHLTSLPLLQVRIKNDPEAYEEEFILQYEHFQSLLQLLAATPQKVDKGFLELVMFLANTVVFYGTRTIHFLKSIETYLVQYSGTTHSETRKTLVKAILSLRTKKGVALSRLLPLLFDLLDIHDKVQRRTVLHYIVHDITANKLLHGPEKSELKHLFFSELKSKTNSPRLNRIVRLVTELFRRNVWREAALVNVLVPLLLQTHSSTLKVTLAKFLLGNYTPLVDADNESSDGENDKKQRPYIIGAKKTRGRVKRLEREQQVEKRKQERRERREKDEASFSGGIVMDFIHDPQRLAEQLLATTRTKSTKDSFATRLLLLNVVSRLIGRYQLLVLPFYATMQRFINSRQTQITKIFSIIAQGCHELVPPDELQPLVKCIMKEFIAEYQTPEAIALGLHAVRKICERTPLAVTEEILEDLCRFHRYKNQLVVVSARSLINLYRDIYPAFLHRTLRGKAAAIEVAHSKDQRPEYGAVCASTYLEDFELLGNPIHTEPFKDGLDEEEDEFNEEEDEFDEEEDEFDEEEDEFDEEDDETQSHDSTMDSYGVLTKDEKGENGKIEKETEAHERRKLNPLDTILEDSDHQLLQNIRKRQLSGPILSRRGSEYEVADESQDEAGDMKAEFDVVDPDDIAVKTRKKGKEYRRAKLRERQQEQLSFRDRAKLRSRSLKASVPNSVQRRNKPLMMVKHKRALVAKNHQDVNAKLAQLRAHLKTLKTTKGQRQKYRRG